MTEKERWSTMVVTGWAIPGRGIEPADGVVKVALGLVLLGAAAVFGTIIF